MSDFVGLLGVLWAVGLLAGFVLVAAWLWVWAARRRRLRATILDMEQKLDAGADSLEAVTGAQNNPADSDRGGHGSRRKA